LVNSITTGKTHAVDVQRHASAIVRDFGHTVGVVSDLAALGAGGQRPEHIHRDFMRYTSAMGVRLEPVTAMITHKLMGDHGSAPQPHRLIYPHELFASAYSAGDKCFAATFLGDGGEDALVDFWTRQKDHDWVKHHPGFELGCEYRHAIPVGVHADKGQHIYRDKMLCISWGSVMSRASTETSKQLFTVCPDELIAKHVTEEELYAVLVWSFHCLLRGTWPASDHTGKPFDKSTFRGLMAGRPLAGPYRCLFAEYRGDWEWVVDTFQWRSHSFTGRRRRNMLSLFDFVNKTQTHVAHGFAASNAAEIKFRIRKLCLHTHTDVAIFSGYNT
jgi:hypothetical protein